MAVVSKSEVSLRLFGEALDPDEVSALLGSPPSSGRRRGDAMRGGAPAREGSWSTSAETRRPADLDAQIVELFAPLTDDLAVWADLASRFRVDLFCGLFVEDGNQGVDLLPATLLMAGERSVKIDFDIYATDAGDI